LKRDVRVDPVEGAEQRRHVDELDRGERADADRAAQAAAHVVDGVAGVADGVERGPRPRQQRLTGVGQLDPLGGALEQAGAQLPLHRLDHGGDAGLDDVQTGRGAGEAALLGDGDEVFEVAQFQHGS
jgi:hypothetical protein